MKILTCSGVYVTADFPLQKLLGSYFTTLHKNLLLSIKRFLSVNTFAP